MNTFPNIERKPEQRGFSVEPTGEAVLIGSVASGYPLLNKLFTYDPEIIKFELPAVIDADKITVMQFYNDNKDVPFYWYNDQARETIEVCFYSQPKCRLDGRRDLWRITIELIQVSP